MVCGPEEISGSRDLACKKEWFQVKAREVEHGSNVRIGGGRSLAETERDSERETGSPDNKT